MEVSGNTRLFYEAVAPHVARVLAVAPNQSQVISHSAKKTDTKDARNLTPYLEKDTAGGEDEGQDASATASLRRGGTRRLSCVRLKNKINNTLFAHSINLEKEAP